MSWFPNGPNRPWNIFSPRTWRTGRRFCAACVWSARTWSLKRASRWHPQITNSRGDRPLTLRLALILVLVAAALAQDRPTFRVKVDMVVLSFQVTDNKGHYVNGLKPKDFRILEDGIAQKVSTFGEGSKAPVEVAADGTLRPIPPSAEGKAEGRVDSFIGTNVFVLFDTSNYMYRGFVYASDAIADFIRGLDRADSVAVYTYSRNLTRASGLSHERNEAIFGLRKAVAGDDSALYNALLLTLRDAAKIPGRKVVIVFSNGPDNAS